MKKSPTGSFVDVYLYDSLSSGAGYAVSVADEFSVDEQIKFITPLHNILNIGVCETPQAA